MRALGLFFPSALVGCILVVSPEEYGTTCRFEGEDTQCGTCIATKCGAELHACCRDASCDSVMFDVDDCAQHSSYTCSVLKGTARRSIAECVKRRCDSVCVELKGSPTTSCREPRLGEGSACTCTANDGEVNDFICSPQTFPSTLCCAPKGWPAPGLECTCRPLDCSPTDEGCFCSLAEFTPKQRECTAVKCCVDKDKCTCRARGCFAFEREVESCNVDVVECAAGQDKVESCSVRAL